MVIFSAPNPSPQRFAKQNAGAAHQPGAPYLQSIQEIDNVLAHSSLLTRSHAVSKARSRGTEMPNSTAHFDTRSSFLTFHHLYLLCFHHSARDSPVPLRLRGT